MDPFINPPNKDLFLIFSQLPNGLYPRHCTLPSIALFFHVRVSYKPPLSLWAVSELCCDFHRNTKQFLHVLFISPKQISRSHNWPPKCGEERLAASNSYIHYNSYLHYHSPLTLTHCMLACLLTSVIQFILHTYCISIHSSIPFKFSSTHFCIRHIFPYLSSSPIPFLRVLELHI